MGGGTGLSTLLRGLKEHTPFITAIVAVTDTGGSSGRLRSELGILPPGDIRDCLIALAETEPVMKQLFQYRFPSGSSLAGHCFGNLFLATMCKVTNNLETAIAATSRVLAVKGQVLPATLTSANLLAQYEDGIIARGETKIASSTAPIRRLSLDPPTCRPVPAALIAIQKADLIVLGPGSLYTSVLPNVLVEGIPAALAASPAIKAYVVNVMTQPGETDGYTASDHVRAVIDYCGKGVIDWVLVNTELPSGAALARYREEGSEPTSVDRKELAVIGPRVKEASLLSHNNMVRHDPDKLAQALLSLIN